MWVKRVVIERTCSEQAVELTEQDLQDFRGYLIECAEAMEEEPYVPELTLSQFIAALLRNVNSPDFPVYDEDAFMDVYGQCLEDSIDEYVRDKAWNYGSFDTYDGEVVHTDDWEITE